MVVFAVLAVCFVVQRFIMRWRVWLSGLFIDDWLGVFAYFRSQFSRLPIDNPGQRIQQDIDIFTTAVLSVLSSSPCWPPPSLPSSSAVP
jgi:putative ATP-binding cassette transporter